MAKQRLFQNPIFQDETKAREALEACAGLTALFALIAATADHDKIAKIEGKKQSHRPGLHYCNECKGQFTVTVGTVFERSKIPLTKWWMAAHMFNSGKNGVSRPRNSPHARRHLQNRLVHDASLARSHDRS